MIVYKNGLLDFFKVYRVRNLNRIYCGNSNRVYVQTKQNRIFKLYTYTLCLSFLVVLDKNKKNKKYCLLLS